MPNGYFPYLRRAVPGSGGGCAKPVIPDRGHIHSAQRLREPSQLVVSSRSKGDACDVDLTTTVIAADGTMTRETWSADPRHRSTASTSTLRCRPILATLPT